MSWYTVYMFYGYYFTIISDNACIVSIAVNPLSLFSCQCYGSSIYVAGSTVAPRMIERSVINKSIESISQNTAILFPLPGMSTKINRVYILHVFPF